MPATKTALKIETRAIRCPLCGESHMVEHKHWFDERGRQVPEREAVMCAHFMAEYDRKARTTPFVIAAPPVAAAQPTVQHASKRAAVEADVKHAPTTGYFLPDWDAFKKSSKKAAR